MLVALAAVLASASFSLVRRSQEAVLRTEQELPAEVQREVDTTWERFDAVFGARRRCMGDVSLLLVDDVAGGDARYVVDDARIEIEIPTSPRRFRDSLTHELAHHVEHTCAAFASLRAEFAALPAVGAGAWATGDRWQEIPAELWAETVVEVVAGERVRYGRTMPLPPGAIELVEAWAAAS